MPLKVRIERVPKAGDVVTHIYKKNRRGKAGESGKTTWRKFAQGGSRALLEEGLMEKCTHRLKNAGPLIRWSEGKEV